MPKYKTLHFNSLTSTQDKAKEYAKKGLGNIVIIADKQTKGRGRFNRKWHSGKGGLWMSIILKPQKIENLQYLTFAAAISVVKSIKKTAKLNTNIKWPNDVHYNGKKLCGILSEGIFGKENFVIVGIGLNINQAEFYGEIKKTATSLRIISHNFFDTDKLAKSILEEFYFIFENYYNKNKLGKILRIWKGYCDTIKRIVEVTTKTKILHGKAINVDNDCSLVLKLKNGRIVKVIEGDISVRY